MRKIALLLALSLSVVSAQTVNSVQISNIGWGSFSYTIGASAAWSAEQLLFSTGSNDCAQPVSGSNIVTTETQYPYSGGPGSTGPIISTGKQPSTVYKVCPQIKVGGTWYGGATATFRTLDTPGGGFQLASHARQVTTTYPADIVNGIYQTVTETNCSSLASDFATALHNLNNQSTVITLPVGLSKACGPTIFDADTPDTLYISNSAVNSDGSITLTNHGYSDGQGVILAQISRYNSQVPNGIPYPCEGPDGRILYVKKKDANSFWLCLKSPLEDGTALKLTAATGNFKLAPYPHPFTHWVVVRTATGDDQFAAPGTALGGLQWLPKMAYFVNPASNRNGGVGLGYTPVISFAGGTDAAEQPMISHVWFIGIAFTVADDPTAYTSPDPQPWGIQVQMAPYTQDVVFDRCAFFLPSPQQKCYSELYFVGLNNAVINSWFDPSLSFYHGRNYGLTVHN